MPGWPWVTPSHMAGTPPATWAVPPAARAASRMIVGIGLVGLVRREHVVVGGDDAEVRRAVACERVLVGGRAGGKAVGEVAAGERERDVRPALRRASHPVEIGSRRGLDAFDDAVGDLPAMRA